MEALMLIIPPTCSNRVPIFPFCQVLQAFWVDVDQQVLQVPREYKVNLETLE
jgi:hypothetical protein